MVRKFVQPSIILTLVGFQIDADMMALSANQIKAQKVSTNQRLAKAQLSQHQLENLKFSWNFTVVYQNNQKSWK